MKRENRLGELNLSHEVLADLLGLHKGAVIHGAEMKRPGDLVTLWVSSPRLEPVREGDLVPYVDLRDLREEHDE